MVAHLAKRTQYHSELVSVFNWLTQEGSTKPFSLREYILLIMTYISNKASWYICHRGRATFRSEWAGLTGMIAQPHRKPVSKAVFHWVSEDSGGQYPNSFPHHPPNPQRPATHL